MFRGLRVIRRTNLAMTPTGTRIGPVRRGGAAGAAGRWKGIRNGDPCGLARARPGRGIGRYPMRNGPVPNAEWAGTQCGMGRYPNSTPKSRNMLLYKREVLGGDPHLWIPKDPYWNGGALKAPAVQERRQATPRRIAHRCRNRGARDCRRRADSPWRSGARPGARGRWFRGAAYHRGPTWLTRLRN